MQWFILNATPFSFINLSMYSYKARQNKVSYLLHRTWFYKGSVFVFSFLGKSWSYQWLHKRFFSPSYSYYCQSSNPFSMAEFSVLYNTLYCRGSPLNDRILACTSIHFWPFWHAFNNRQGILPMLVISNLSLMYRYLICLPNRNKTLDLHYSAI